MPQSRSLQSHCISTAGNIHRNRAAQIEYIGKMQMELRQISDTNDRVNGYAELYFRQVRKDK